MENIYLVINIDGKEATAMVARKDSDGIITPIATETEALNISETKNGIINLNGDVQMAISHLQNTIKNKMEGTNYEVKGVYLGIMPRSLHGEHIEVRKEFDGKHRITQRDIDNLRREVTKKVSNKIIKICENGYVRDGAESTHVIGEIADSLVMKSLAVVVTPKNDISYEQLMNSSTELKGVIPTHLAIAKLVTDEDQRVNGVIAMHIGRQSTGMTYYCNDMVMATVVVPFGFDHAIHDMSLGEVSEDKLETYLSSEKVQYEWGDDYDKKVTFRNGASEKIPYHIVRGMEAYWSRFREIYELGYNRMIVSAGLDNIEVPIVLTTAVVNSDEFCEKIKEVFEREVIKGDVGCKLSDDKFSNPKYISLISLINEATENCVIKKETVIEPKEPIIEEPLVEENNEVKNGGKSRWGNLFGKKDKNGKTKGEEEKSPSLFHQIKDNLTNDDQL